MSTSEAFLQEFDHEMRCARRTLERIPEDKLGWKPHEKSMTLGRLAGHLAEIPGYGTTALTTEKLDLSQRPTGYKPSVAESQTQVLELFDQKAADARAAIAGTSEAAWNESWTMAFGDRVVFNGPRIAAVRSIMMNHFIHHRAQLGIYLRLNDVPVPSTYGPSADEGN